MISYTIAVEVDQPLTPELAFMVVDVPGAYHPSTESRQQRTEITLTVPAGHLHGATMAALGLIHLHQPGEPVAVRLRSTADRDLWS